MPPPSTPPLVVTINAIPAITIQDNQMVVGDANSSSVRSYTLLKRIGDGTFATVWLCDWHSVLPPNTPLSPMQFGQGARPEYANRRLVVIKKIKKEFRVGWDECQRLKELQALRNIPPHPNLITLYDCFLLPSSKELHLVFEPMEGNLYQLIKSRKGIRPFAGGLITSISHQIISGLLHIHNSNYFHRDLKPENLLVTTTGLADYPLALGTLPASQKDVVVIVKLADFGLARETNSDPPYTEYVSVRWYRAPEILLRGNDYSKPVDMWALGAVLTELITLKPLFPGQGEIDQVDKICKILGDPAGSDDYDGEGGGKWVRGLKMAKEVGIQFPEHAPVDFHSLFESYVSSTLVNCIAGLLKWDPEARLTAQECMDRLSDQDPRSSCSLRASSSIANNSSDSHQPR